MEEATRKRKSLASMGLGGGWGGEQAQVNMQRTGGEQVEEGRTGGFPA